MLLIRVQTLRGISLSSTPLDAAAVRSIVATNYLSSRGSSIILATHTPPLTTSPPTALDRVPILPRPLRAVYCGTRRASRAAYLKDQQLSHGRSSGALMLRRVPEGVERVEINILLWHVFVAVVTLFSSALACTAP